MKGRDRNAPCWCGSGKKYKKCHLNRDSQKRENPWDAVDANRKAFQQKKCFASNSGLGACNGSIVKAHSISRANLRKIAKSGTVIHYNSRILKMNKNNSKPSAEKIGIGKASVFYGFCEKHDRNLFSCIENESFSGRPDQCLAIAYRTMSRELYLKDAASHLPVTLHGADKGMSLAYQIHYQQFLNSIRIGNEAAKEELGKTYQKLTQALVSRRPEILQSLVLRFDRPLPFLFAGAWSPFNDLYGKFLQDGYTGDILEQIFLSSFTSENTGYVCISWLDKKDAPGKIIAEQIQNLPTEKKSEAILLLSVMNIENIFYDPVWYRSLKSNQQNLLDTLVSSSVESIVSIPLISIMKKAVFDLPNVVQTFSTNDK